ncbi:MAG TPA: hypothetical protein ENK55_09960 [Actinobacteria bacterium]|nr:hypothetical protein [Actinomycetota bacterium]
MKLAVAGKGGSGKTTIAGTLARTFARAGRTVLAIDGDGNPNLGPTIGIPKERFDAGTPIPHDILEHREHDGEVTVELALPLDEVVDRYALEAADGIRLLTMARPERAGGG